MNKFSIKYILPLTILLILVSGCGAIAIVPAKIVYMYPTGELYDIEAANGAVAKVDNGTMSLYLPMFSKGDAKPKRFQFTWNASKKVWNERRGLATIETVSSATTQPLPSGKTLHLEPNMILVKFSDNPKNKDLSGKMLWLTANVGGDEISKIRGVYFKSDASFQELFDQPASVSKSD